jgi:hypothetical protein
MISQSGLLIVSKNNMSGSVYIPQTATKLWNLYVLLKSLLTIFQTLISK